MGKIAGKTKFFPGDLCHKSIAAKGIETAEKKRGECAQIQ